jgi:hypothetical protein
LLVGTAAAALWLGELVPAGTAATTLGLCERSHIQTTRALDNKHHGQA